MKIKSYEFLNSISLEMAKIHFNNLLSERGKISDNKLIELELEIREANSKVAEARLDLDARENAELTSATERLNSLLYRQHEHRVTKALLQEFDQGFEPDGYIDLGSVFRVVVQEENRSTSLWEDSGIFTCILVPDAFEDATNGLIAPQSKMGKALTGKTIDDCALVQINGTNIKYRVKGVL